MGRAGQFTFKGASSRRISQLPDNPYVGLSRNGWCNCGPAWMRNRYGNKGQAVIPQWGFQCVISNKAARSPLQSNHGISKAYEPGGAVESYDAWIWFFNLVCDAAGRAFGQGYGCSFQRRPDTQIVTPAGVFVSSSQAHAQRQERRGGLQKGQETACTPEKKAMKTNAKEALVFQDELEIHRHPTLTRMWGLKGIQPEVPSPERTKRRVVYGGVDYT